VRVVGNTPSPLRDLTLEGKEKDMELGTTLRDGKFITCPSCEELVKRMHSAQSDRLDMAKKIKDLQAHISRLEKILAEQTCPPEAVLMVDKWRQCKNGVGDDEICVKHWREWLMRETD